MKPRVLATQCLSYVHLQAWVPDWVSSLSSISSKNVWLCVIMVQICSWAFESIQYTQPKPEKGFVGLGIPKSGSSSWFPNKNMACFGAPISGQSCFWGVFSRCNGHSKSVPTDHGANPSGLAHLPWIENGVPYTQSREFHSIFVWSLPIGINLRIFLCGQLNSRCSAISEQAISNGWLCTLPNPIYILGVVGFTSWYPPVT